MHILPSAGIGRLDGIMLLNDTDVVVLNVSCPPRHLPKAYKDQRCYTA